MAATLEFTRKWSGDSRERTKDQRSFTVEWDVKWSGGTLSSAEVENHPDAPVKFNDPDPDDPGSLAKCSRISVTRAGFKSFTYTAFFSIPTTGSTHTGGGASSSPLAEPPVYRWESVLYNLPVDRDVDGNPIIHSGGGAFGSLPTRDIEAIVLTVTKNFSNFDTGRAMNFGNSVNSSPFKGAAADEVRCRKIVVAGDFQTNASYVSVVHEFEFRDQDTWGLAPHDYRIMDQGYMARCTTTDSLNTLCKILMKDGSEPPEPVRLDGRGKPINASVYVPEGGTGFISGSSPAGAVLEQTPDAVFLRYKAYKRRDLNALGV